MNGRLLGALGAGILAGSLGLGEAHSSLKDDGSLPLVMPNTLLVEAGERVGPAPEQGTQPKVVQAVADLKRSPRSCSAAAVQITGRGTRIVTARHCADHRALDVLDDDHQVTPVGEIDAVGDVDLAVLDVKGTLPWSGLEMRSSASVADGERLCAWRMHRGIAGLQHERICARVLRREARPGAKPLMVMSHPYPAGTSGSALVDAKGRVVGIVVASTGLTGLAEPIEGVLDVLSLAQTEK
jgi:hypothetical protein